MKQKSTNQRNWQRVPHLRLELKRLENLTLVYLQALEVKTPLIVPCCGEQLKIMDTGYQWLYICKSSDPFCVTSQFNEKNKPVQWYIDVLGNWHYDKEGFPYFDDLYLDVVASSKENIEIQDADELDEALLKKDINQAQYDFAWETARTIVTAIETDRFEPIKMSQVWLELFQS